MQYRVLAYDDASSSTAAYEQSLFLNGIMIVKPCPSFHVSSTILSTGKQCNISVFQMLAFIYK